MPNDVIIVINNHRSKLMSASYTDTRFLMIINFLFLFLYTFSALYTLFKTRFRLDKSAYWVIAGG